MSSTAAADSCETQEEQGTTTALGAAVSVAHRKRDPEMSGDCWLCLIENDKGSTGGTRVERGTSGALALRATEKYEKRCER